MSKLKLLITGASGFVGSNFIIKTHDRYKLSALIRENSDISAIKDCCEIHRFSDLASLENMFRENSFDGVIHFAAHCASDKPSDIDSLISANIAFGTKLLESMNANPPKFFINTMTFAEYANANEFTPFNLYASTKRAFFDIIKYYAQILPTNFSHLLLYDTYGKNDKRRKIFNLWKDCYKNNEALEMSSGTQQIDISHIDDVVRAFDALVTLHTKNKIPPNRIYNLESKKRHSLRELSKIFEKHTGAKLNIKWGAREERKGEIKIPVSRKTCKELHKIPHFKKKVSLKKGLSDFLS